MSDKQNCEKMVADSSGWRSSQCTRTATVEFNGKHYCKQHAIQAGWHDESSVMRHIYAIDWSDYDGAKVGWLDIRITGKRATVEAIDMRLPSYKYYAVKNVSELTPGNLYFQTETQALQAAKEITETHIKRHTDMIAKLRYTIETFDVRLMQAENVTDDGQA